MPNKITIKIKLLNEDAKIPTQGSPNSAGFDIYSCEDNIIYPGETKMIHSGISLELPPGKVCFIWDRSGMGFKGIHRFAGVIDSDYRGEYNIILHNTTSQPFKIKKGDRIAQGVIQDYYQAEFIESELSETQRGEGSFGSTGV
jgi:dUTP pyrophosphatase